MKVRRKDPLAAKRPLFFLIGLCSSLFVVLLLFQVKSKQQAHSFSHQPGKSLITELEIPITRPKKPKVPEQSKTLKQEKKKFIDWIIEIPNNDGRDDNADDSLFVFDDITWGGEPEPVLQIDLPALDKKPVFPGCENLLSENERYACFQEKIIAFVQENYTPCGNNGMTRQEKLYIKFVIDENGQSTEAEIIRGIDRCNMENALDLVSKLPRMKPGMYRDKVVKTSFVLPINIK